MRNLSASRAFTAWVGVLALTLGLLSPLLPTQTVQADHTPDPASVTIAGSLQSELGCPGDWQPECATTHLAYDFSMMSGKASSRFRPATGNTKLRSTTAWDENYGANAQPNGVNIPLNLAACNRRQILLQPHDPLGN